MASVADYSAALSGNQLERDAAGHRRGTVGCLDFAITADLIDPGRVNIFERWESHGAVEAFRGGGPGDDQGAAIVSASVAEYDIAVSAALARRRHRLNLVIEPLTLAVPEAELEDLRARLRATRWPDPATDPRQGVALERLQERCARWAEDYDWRATERRLNAVSQFTTMIDGLRIHFLHARSPRRDAFPLVLTHGWPGSVVEFLDVLPLLTETGFHCVVPSLPGYGWSGKPTGPGWGVARIARAWATLMARLGYARYGAQGTDWGTSISASLGQQDREHVAGIHLMPPLAPTTAAGRQADDDAGYSIQQRTRPQTVGYALTDSPAGLAAWIGEKLDSWTDRRTPIPEHRILDTLMLYWLPRTAASSARLYWESLDDVTRWLQGPLEPDDRVDAPAGCTIFPRELQRPTRDQAAARFTDIRHWSEPERGGHFPALEQPETFAAELAAFFALVR